MAITSFMAATLTGLDTLPENRPFRLSALPLATGIGLTPSSLSKAFNPIVPEFIFNFDVT